MRQMIIAVGLLVLLAGCAQTTERTGIDVAFYFEEGAQPLAIPAGDKCFIQLPQKGWNKYLEHEMSHCLGIPVDRRTGKVKRERIRHEGAATKLAMPRD